MTVTERIRAHLLKAAGLGPAHPDLEYLRATQWSARFEQLMRNRLIMGSFRYSRGTPVPDNDPIPEGVLANDMHRRICLYVRTGNTEHLVDVANLALIEFEVGVHPKKHWRADDDTEHAPTVK